MGAYPRGRGGTRDTTKEHGAAVFADGHSESFGGAFENRLQVPRFSAPDGSVTIHHNHPNGDSLSRADLFIMLERPELGRVDAHGHQGFWASAERPGTAMAPEEAMATVEDAAARARTMLTKAVQRGHIRAEAAQSGLWQVVMSRLLEQQGIIRYTVNSEAVLAMANQVLQ